MTDRPSDRAIARAFEVELAKLPAGAQQNIRDAMARDESLSWGMFRAGWLAAAPDGAQAVPFGYLVHRSARLLGDRYLTPDAYAQYMAGHYDGSDRHPSDTFTALYTAPPSQDAEDAARYRHARDNHLAEMLAIYPTPDTSDVGLDAAIDAARAAAAAPPYDGETHDPAASIT